MQKKQTDIATDNEKLKRLIYTKEKLLEAQDQSNKEYIAKLRVETDEMEADYKCQIANHMM